MGLVVQIFGAVRLNTCTQSAGCRAQSYFAATSVFEVVQLTVSSLMLSQQLATKISVSPSMTSVQRCEKLIFLFTTPQVKYNVCCIVL